MKEVYKRWEHLQMLPNIDNFGGKFLCGEKSSVYHRHGLYDLIVSLIPI